MGVDGQPFLVQAVYSFKGKNNDELCFKKGDIITVTQEEDGGWWEGTLGEKTGWFPSNYVKEYKVQSEHLSPLKIAGDIAAQQRAYRTVVLKDLVDAERSYIGDLQHLLNSILQPVEKFHMLTKEEYQSVLNNIKEVVNFHETLLSNIEATLIKSPNEQRVGKVMLSMAPRLKQIHQIYCKGHPTAAFIVNKHKDKLSTLFQGDTPGSGNVLALTSGLSKPFRRLEKYNNHLQELERHLEESHPDRGDTQRAAAVYKEIAVSCSLIRRQKEMELEITTGGVRGWEGQDIAKLGEIIHMGSVAVGADHKDRYLVLFPTTLLMLSTSHRMSAFIYEGKLPLTGIKVNKLDDTENYKNAFEITGCLIERILAICQTKEDQQKWVDCIRKQCDIIGSKSPLQRASEIVVDPNEEGPWSISRLRPSAPSRSCLLKVDKPSLKSERSFEEDAEILRVIESYCTSANSRFTLNSDMLDSSFKSLDDKLGNCNNSCDLTCTVSELREKILLIQNELDTLKVDVKGEKSAREQLQAILGNQVNGMKPINELVIND